MASKWYLGDESVAGFCIPHELLPVIFVKKSSPALQTLTLFHQLAHLLLHDEPHLDSPAQLKVRQGASKDAQANRLAYECLQPDECAGEIVCDTRLEIDPDAIGETARHRIKEVIDTFGIDLVGVTLTAQSFRLLTHHKACLHLDRLLWEDYDQLKKHIRKYYDILGGLAWKSVMLDACSVNALHRLYPPHKFRQMCAWLIQQNIAMAVVNFEEVAGHSLTSWLVDEAGLEIIAENSAIQQQTDLLHAELAIPATGYSTQGGVGYSDLIAIATAEVSGYDLITEEEHQEQLPTKLKNYRIPAVCRSFAPSVQTCTLSEWVVANYPGDELPLVVGNEIREEETSYLAVLKPALVA